MDQTYTLKSAGASISSPLYQENTFGTYTDVVTPGYQGASVRTFQWRRRGTTSGSLVPTVLRENIVVGDRTAYSALPRTGSAAYAVQFYLDKITPNTGPIDGLEGQSGVGSLLADFGTAAITLNGRFYNDDALSGKAKLSSVENKFSGTLAVSGSENASGTWVGSFFGASYGEVGGVMNLQNGTGKVLAGAFIGAQDASLLPSTQTLGKLVEPTRFTANGFLDRVTQANSGAYYQLDYDPTNKVFAFSSAEPNLWQLDHFDLNPQNLLRYTDTKSFAIYGDKVTIDEFEYEYEAYRPNAAVVKFSYASFVNVFYRNPADPGSETVMTMNYGLETPVKQLPVTGTATYTGIAFGGAIRDSDPTARVLVDGTSLFNVDFLKLSLTGALNLQMSQNGQVTPLGDFKFSTNLASNINSGTMNYFSGSFESNPGLFEGRFYGPNAAEIGGSFSLGASLGAEQIKLNGGFLAKK